MEVLPDTLGSLKAEVIDWLSGEKVPESRVSNAINDAIESLWESLVIFSLEIMTGGPVNIAFNAGDERVRIVTIQDPTIAPTAVDVAEGSLPEQTYFVAYTYVT